LHLAYRFAGGEDAGADYYGRLFDPVVNGAGPEPFANPEVSLRTPLLALSRVEVAIEGRVVVPDSGDSEWLVVPGLPVRLHFAGVPAVRLDTGLYLPFTTSGYSVQVPAQLFFQWGREGEWFAGPLLGLLFASGNEPDPALSVGVGGGRTFGGVVDVKAQVLATQLNDTNWAKYLGGGVGVGLRMP
jgi:hypothetical protein